MNNIELNNEIQSHKQQLKKYDILRTVWTGVIFLSIMLAVVGINFIHSHPAVVAIISAFGVFFAMDYEKSYKWQLEKIKELRATEPTYYVDEYYTSDIDSDDTSDLSQLRVKLKDISDIDKLNTELLLVSHIKEFDSLFNSLEEFKDIKNDGKYNIKSREDADKLVDELMTLQSTFKDYQVENHIKTAIKEIKDKITKFWMFEPTHKPELKQVDSDLLSILKLWRNGIAKERKLSSFCILNNSILKDIATILPTTKDELLEIKGIGNAKVEQYGNAIIGLINNKDVNSKIPEINVGGDCDFPF